MIGAGATIGANAVISGPCSIGANARIRPLAQIREGTTIGAGLTIGGEVSQSIFLAQSNKGHEGFVGHSYVGKWVNLGSGTATSNLKNTYGEVLASESVIRRYRRAGNSLDRSLETIARLPFSPGSRRVHISGFPA